MVLALITIFGRRFELVLRPLRSSRISNRPPVADATIETTGESLEVSGPGLAKTRPVLRVVKTRAA